MRLEWKGAAVGERTIEYSTGQRHRMQAEVLSDGTRWCVQVLDALEMLSVLYQR